MSVLDWICSRHLVTGCY